MATSSNPPLTTATAPFDDEGADIIFLSSDNVQFHVYKLLLSLASSVFASMFTLPQPAAASHEPVTVSEDGKTLDGLLRFCYPYSDPRFRDLDQLKKTLIAVKKYDMKEQVVARAKRSLLAFVRKEPLRVFAIAHNQQWSDVAAVAAKETLHSPLGEETYVPEMELITFGAYHRLRDYHRRCGEAAAALFDHGIESDFKVFLWIPMTPWTWIDSGYCEDLYQWTLSVSDDGEPTEVSVCSWFMEYLEKACEDLQSSPTARTVTDPALMAPFLEKAAECEGCRPQAFEQLMEFATVNFAAEINKVVAAVSAHPSESEHCGSFTVSAPGRIGPKNVARRHKPRNEIWI